MAVFGVIALLPILYVASFGPACWIGSRTNVGAGFIRRLYHPLFCSFYIDPQHRRFIGTATHWYHDLGAAEGWGWGYSDDSQASEEEAMTWRKIDDGMDQKWPSILECH